MGPSGHQPALLPNWTPYLPLPGSSDQCPVRYGTRWARHAPRNITPPRTWHVARVCSAAPHCSDPDTGQDRIWLETQRRVLCWLCAPHSFTLLLAHGTMQMMVMMMIYMMMICSVVPMIADLDDATGSRGEEPKIRK